MIQHGKNGFKCQPENAAGYVYYLKKILSDASLKKNLVIEGLSYVGQLDWNRLAGRYFNDIELLIDKTQEVDLAWAN